MSSTKSASHSFLHRIIILSALAGAIALSTAPCARAAVEIPPARVKEIAAMLPAQPRGLGRPITDRAAWNKLAPNFSSVVATAENLAKTPCPPWSDDLYLDFSKTGQRNPGQRMMAEPRQRLEVLTIAECVENKGRFLPPLEAAITALCNQPTWLYAAHDRGLTTYSGRTMDMDLSAVAIAWQLSTADYLLGDKLSKASRTLIRENLQRRIFKPLRDMVEGRRQETGWLRRHNNWNAVCLAGVTGAALATIESPEERAWFIAVDQYYIRYFLSSFTPDGYCSEGLGYWNYGYGHFLMLGETVRQATNGKIDLLADPTALQPALFGMRAEILNEVYPSISDAGPGVRPSQQYNRFLAERLGLPVTGNRDDIFRSGSDNLIGVALFAFLDQSLPLAQRAPAGVESPLRTWFKDGGVLICRPTPQAGPQFAAVLKGGHNAEEHNHNDVGSFSVVVGKTMILCDPGAEVYTGRTFSSKRYDSKVINSFGHAVPVVAGKLQTTGAAARATILQTDFNTAADTLVLDISSAYAVPDLKKLERTFKFQRGPTAGLTVSDAVGFKAPEKFETALITWSPWKQVSETELLFTEGKDVVRVKIDTGGQPFEIKSETLNEDVHTPRKPIRIGISLKSPVKEATVTLRITPE